VIKGWSWSRGGGTSATFKTIQTPSGTSPVATGEDILTLTSSDNSITITGNSATDTIDFVVAAAPTGDDTVIFTQFGGF
jgi:hypothetical protein